MQIHSFLDKDTETFTHVLADKASQLCAVIDPVLDFDYKSGRTLTHSADQVIDFIHNHGLTVRYTYRNPRPRRPSVISPLYQSQTGRWDCDWQAHWYGSKNF